MQHISKDLKKIISVLNFQNLNYFIANLFFIIILNACVSFSLAQSSLAPITPQNNAQPNEIRELFRVNISWNTEEPQFWLGELCLSSGCFSDSVPLANNPTSPVVFHTEKESQGIITFRTLTPSLFCGVQTTILSTINDVLTIDLTNIQSGKKIQNSIKLDSFINEPHELLYQPENNASKSNIAINIERIAGDELPIRITHLHSNGSSEKEENMIFDPAESLQLSVFPRFLSVPFQENLSLQVQLFSTRSDQILWSETKELSSNLPQGLDFTLTLPDLEGVFNIKIVLTKTNKQKSFSLIIPNKETEKSNVLVQRIVQGIIVSSTNVVKSENKAFNESDFDLRDGIIETIDPSNPVWWKVFAKRPFLTSLKKEDSNLLKGFSVQNNIVSSNALVPQNNSTLILNENEWDNQDFLNDEFSSEEKENKTADHLTVLGQNSDSSFLKGNHSKSQSIDWLRNWNFGGIQTRLNSIKLKNWGQWEDLWKNSRGSGHLQPYSSQKSPFESFVQLAPSFNPEVVPWESYSIPIKEPGKPHLLEIEYISNVPQTLGISILEPSITGGVFPLTLDNGLIVPDDPLSDQMPNRILRYQILFWPKTKTPIILLMNRQTDKPAVFGRIRIYRAKDNIAALQTEKRGRSVAAMMTRPNFCDQFSAFRADSSVGVIGADDWNTFYDSIQRMTQYLQFVGYDCLMLSVVADGSSLYPSSLLNPSPNFDSGIFLKNGEDPYRKDVLELLTRTFDSKQLSVIPLIDLNAPLPTLERKFRDVCQRANERSASSRKSTHNSFRLANQSETIPAVYSQQQWEANNRPVNAIQTVNDQSNDVNVNNSSVSNIASPLANQPLNSQQSVSQSLVLPSNSLDSIPASFDSVSRMEGIYWIGPDGRLLIESRKTDSGTGPYYNILHPIVQETILEIVQEIVSRYGQHRSFGGLAIQLSTNGFAQLPDDIYFGMDDETITRFARETNLQEKLLNEKKVSIDEFLTISGLKKYRFRAQFIKDYCQEEWINWRSETVYQFYDKIRQTIAERRPDTKLYLVGTNMLDGKISRSQLYPTLSRQTDLNESIRRIGFDLELFSKNSAIIFLRPGFEASTSKLNQKASLMEFDSPNAISLFSKNVNNVGTFFYHQPEKKNIASFDQQSPFHPTITQIETRAVSLDYENRRRYMNQLANCDTFYFFDGGEMFPMGAEESLRDFIAVFKDIPQIPFQTWSANNDNNGKEKSIQPIIIRFSQTKKETWVYLLNNAPFHTNIRLSMKYQPNAQFELLGKNSAQSEPMLGVDSFVWPITLNPFGLIAFRLSDPKATIDYIDVSCPNEICGPNGRLSTEVQDFVDRVLIARLGVETPMRNADFDEFSSENKEPSSKEHLADQNASENSQPVSLTNPKSKAILGLEMPKMNLLKNPFDALEKKENDLPKNQGESLSSQTVIPGWRSFGGSQFVASLDSENSKNGQFSLKLASSGEVGGIISEPFAPPTTGRLCVQLYFGISEQEKSLPLRICLTGRYRGTPYSRLLMIGPTILQRVQQAQANKEIESQNGIFWFQDVILFDRLPLDGLEDVSIRFDLLSQGTVWIDQIRLYKLAFADLEQNELMRLINTVEYRVEKNRVIDSMNLLNGYWAKLLEEQIPDHSALMINRPPHPPRTTAETTPDKNSEEKESQTFFQKMMFWR